MTSSPSEHAARDEHNGMPGLKIWGGILATSIAASVVASGSALALGTPLPPWLPLGLGSASAIALAGTMRSLARLLRQMKAASRVLAGDGSAATSRAGIADDLVAEAQKANDEIGKYRLEVERLQDIDPVTGLGNRRWLQIRAMQEFSRAQREDNALSLILLKIDGYDMLKAQGVGSAVETIELHVADTLKSFVRPYDIVARVSASEFCVLLLGATTPTAISIAHRLKNAVAAQPPLLLGQAMPEIAVAAVERLPSETNFDELLDRARAFESPVRQKS
ncbi:diguanylate cyclase (GGDEF)-like protein [Bosea sp. AK1]|uniref:GGDEF domain-containing protein n=1 Tax=unclassified Bosea (in: a-proteobacteria) TaxID=2653178 RepID=UPI0009E6CAC1|nr:MULTISPECIES: GGDEF domain-containing protein [unclassified Bosea (in: a-proteobacteria)]TQI75275.1 diguanylate cyclase (GGDEF)-like protein [Bosea sp. AK1]